MTTPPAARLRRWMLCGAGNAAGCGLWSAPVPSRTAADAREVSPARGGSKGAGGGSYSPTAHKMGQAKRRKQQLGGLYGTPNGSNRSDVAHLKKNQTFLYKTYLSLDSQLAYECRLLATERYLARCGFDKRSKELPQCFWHHFKNLLGHIFMPGREVESWCSIRDSLVCISCGEEERKSFKTWPHGPELNLLETPDPRHACWAALEKMPDLMVNTPEWKDTNCWLFKKNKELFYDIPQNHLHAMSCLANGSVLHRSGSLFLVDKACGRQQRDEQVKEGRDSRDRLGIFKLRPDGVFALGALANTGTLQVSEIKDMRFFVEQYKGSPISGKFRYFTAHTSARIAKAIGLQIQGEWAHLQ